jgi:pimeloyl-ACP methyl ester carboxylesterase
MRGTAQRVLKFAENLGVESFDLLGTSRGGAVAMSAAAQGIDGHGAMPRVRRLVLVAPVNPYSPHGKRLAPFFGTRFGAALFRLATKHLPLLFPYFHERLYADHHRIPDGSLAGYVAPTATPGLFEHGLSIVRTWTVDLQELEELLPKLASIPTLLMWGDKDPAVYVSSMGPLARHFAEVRKIVFAGVGHLPYEECAAEFNRALIEFLTGHESKHPLLAKEARSGAPTPSAL